MASLLMQNVCVLLRATTLTIPTKDTFEQDQSRKFEKRAPQGCSLNSIVNLELCKNSYDYSSIPIPASVISSRFCASSSEPSAPRRSPIRPMAERTNAPVIEQAASLESTL